VLRLMGSDSLVVEHATRVSGGQSSITYASNLDPDSYFEFMAKIED
jgi:hypothetical protein